MIVIADSSALIALATCSALGVLVDLFEEIYVPPAVFDELNQPNRLQAEILSQFLHNRIVPADGPLIIVGSSLGRGESEAMVLYSQLGADYLLVDDRRAKRFAEANQIRCIGSLGVLLLAKYQGHITKIAPFIDRLRYSSLHYTETLLQKVLELAEES